MSPLVLWLLLSAVATVLLLALALVGRAREQAVARRVSLITNPRLPAQGLPEVVPVSHWSPRSIFTIRMRRVWGVSSSFGFLLGLGIATALAVGVLGRLALHLPSHVTALAAVVGFFLVPRIVMAREQARADARFVDMLPDGIDMVVRTLRVGLPVSVAIRTVGQDAKPPVSTVFAAVADQADIGVPVNEALARMAMTVGNPELRFLATAVALQQSTGGNLAATLEALSQILRKRRSVRLKARAASAEVRMSAIVLGAMPFLVTGALLVVAPTYLDVLFVDPRGKLILGLALVGLLMAGVTMRTMIRNSLTY
ncbi:MAG: type II secretion system F family protein [Thiohalocapsa sp.]